VTVGELMSRELTTVARDATLREAAERMVARRVGSVLVFEGERLVGILTERDVLKAVARGSVDARVDEWMTRHPETIEAGNTVEQAAVVMLHGGFRHLPVADGEQVIGVLSMRDVMSVVAGDQAPRGV
jgi:CBS domain-containing protein